MSMIEDEALAVYAAAQAQQVAVNAAIDAMNKASKDLGGRYAEFMTAIGQMREVPKESVNAIKTAVVASVDAGLDQHLTTKTNALNGAINAAVKRVNQVRTASLLDMLLYSVVGGIVGGLVVAALLVYAVKSGYLPIANQLDPKATADFIGPYLKSSRR